jgi:hypothetical protein
MAKYKITYSRQGENTEDVEADDFVDEGNQGEWITFRRHGMQYPTGVSKVLRIPSRTVDRIERVSD